MRHITGSLVGVALVTTAALGHEPNIGGVSSTVPVDHVKVVVHTGHDGKVAKVTVTFMHRTQTLVPTTMERELERALRSVRRDLRGGMPKVELDWKGAWSHAEFDSCWVIARKCGMDPGPRALVVEQIWGD